MMRVKTTYSWADIVFLLGTESLQLSLVAHNTQTILVYDIKKLVAYNTQAVLVYDIKACCLQYTNFKL